MFMIHAYNILQWLTRLHLEAPGADQLGRQAPGTTLAAPRGAAPQTPMRTKRRTKSFKEIKLRHTIKRNTHTYILYIL